MITPFGLRHILLLRDLQSDSTIVDLNTILAEPVTPLRAALRGYCLGPRSGIFTYVLHASDLHGFAQARTYGPGAALLGRGGAAWSILRMAPALDSSEDAATIWYRLLLHLCIAAGERRVQRLFVRLPADGPAEEVFRQAGFAVYAHERVFSHSCSAGMGKLSSNLRPAQPDDLWDIQRLYHQTTPRLVLQVEEPNDVRGDSQLPETRSLPVPALPKVLGEAGLSLAQANAEQSYVLYGRDGDMLGYMCALVGAHGSWLRFMVHPNANDCVEEILDHALALLGANSLRPLYCAVREYQGGVQALLEDRGFTPVDRHSLLVKHTTVRVREPLRKWAHALEKRAEIAPTVSHSEAEPGAH